MFGSHTVMNAGILLLSVKVTENFIKKIYKKQIASPAVNLCPSPPRVFLFEIKNPSSVNIKIENEYENLSCCSI